MRDNVSAASSPSQQTGPSRFALAQRLHDASLAARLATARLTDAWMATVKHLPARPPTIRHLWDNAVRSESPIRPKGSELLDALRLVVASAVATHDRAIIDATALEIGRYFDELRAQALAGVPVMESPSLTAATMTATKETTEAVSAIAAAGITRSHSEIERALAESDEAIVAIHAFRETAGRMVRTVGAR